METSGLEPPTPGLQSRGFLTLNTCQDTTYRKPNCTECTTSIVRAVFNAIPHEWCLSETRRRFGAKGRGSNPALPILAAFGGVRPGERHIHGKWQSGGGIRGSIPLSLLYTDLRDTVISPMLA